MGKYEEVVHNLKFAKELQKTIGSLTQDVRLYACKYRAESNCAECFTGSSDFLRRSC